MNVLIVDDEFRARKGLSDQIQQLYPNTFSLNTADSVKEGVEKMKEFSPAIVFLDIQMDDGSGFDFLNQLPRRNFELIFTTAYEEYALEAFEHEAAHYLLKPISPKKLSEALERVLANIQNLESVKRLVHPIDELMAKGSQRFRIPVSNGFRFIDGDSIIYVKAEGNYFNIFLQDSSSLLVSKTLRFFEEQMNPKHFMRVHKSYIVNMSKVQEFNRSGGGTLSLLGGTEIPISNKYKDLFLTTISSKGG